MEYGIDNIVYLGTGNYLKIKEERETEIRNISVICGNSRIGKFVSTISK